MQKKLLGVFAAISCLLLLAAPAKALPVVDLDLGARYWGPSPSGDLGYVGDSLDLEDNLDFDREWEPYFFARFSIPTVIIDAHYTSLGYSGESDVFPDTDFGDDIDLSQYTTISAEADLDVLHAGAMFSPPLTVPFMDLDLGIGAGAHYLEAKASIEAQNGAAEEDSASARAVVPVAKGYFSASPPTVDLHLTLAGEGIAYSGHSFYDLRATVDYRFRGLLIGDLALEAGYRTLGVDYDSDDLVLDTSFSGPFAGLKLAF